MIQQEPTSISFLVSHNTHDGSLGLLSAPDHFVQSVACTASVFKQVVEFAFIDDMGARGMMEELEGSCM